MQEESDERHEDEGGSFLVDFNKALIGGAAAVLVAVAGILAVGQVSSAEGRVLLTSMFPTTRFLCSSVMTASATILALMLTMLSLSQSVSDNIKSVHYRRICDIARFDTITFVGATLLLLFHSVPIEESDKVPHSWYGILYYVLLCLSAIIGGMLVTTVLMLYGTTRDMIHVVGGLEDPGLLLDDEDDDEDG